MAAISSPILKSRTKVCYNKTCKACGLYLNQPPIYDKQRRAGVFWVGLSAVQFDEDEEKLPLASSTPSGKLIQTIELPFKNTVFYKTNLVKCVPLKQDKIRYPFQHEMIKCFPNFQWELKQFKPQTVFLLGKQVSSFVIESMVDLTPAFSDNFVYIPIEINGIKFIPIHHPSYMIVYKRKFINEYIANIQKMIPQKNKN